MKRGTGLGRGHSAPSFLPGAICTRGWRSRMVYTPNVPGFAKGCALGAVQSRKAKVQSGCHSWPSPNLKAQRPKSLPRSQESLRAATKSRPPGVQSEVSEAREGSSAPRGSCAATPRKYPARVGARGGVFDANMNNIDQTVKSCRTMRPAMPLIAVPLWKPGASDGAARRTVRSSRAITVPAEPPNRRDAFRQPIRAGRRRPGPAAG